jgi:hypothetical protein
MHVPGECPFLLSCVRLPLVLTVEISVRLQELGCHKPSLPPVSEDAVDRAARRVAAEKKKEKKDAKKARARERMRARCGRTSQVIGPTCTCPCLKDLRQLCMCTK